MFKIISCLLLFSLVAQASGEFKDYMLQASKIEAPKRGTLKGEYASFGEKALSLKTGSFSIALPLKFPNAKGKLLYPFAVNYSPSFGLTSFGNGWNSNLKIMRTRDLGVLNYTDDNLSTPWGRMIKGDSGFYYTEDLSQRIKLAILGKEIIVYLPNGDKFYFGDLSDDSYFEETLNNNVITWFPNKIESAIGNITKYKYERFSTDGASYLTEILYGGLGLDFQYKIHFEYLSSAYPVYKYASGVKRVEDKLVDKIRISSFENNQFHEIYLYELKYKQNVHTPGAYLVSIQQFYGASALPKIVYNYDEAQDFLNATNWQENTELSDLAKKFKTKLTNYYFTNLNDFNNDGRLDLELGQEYALYENTDNGFVEKTRTLPLGDISTWCLFPVEAQRKGRRFLQFLGNNTQTFVYDLFKYEGQTVLDICRPNGERVDYFVFPKFWEKGPKTIFADINRDNKPDLIHLRGDAYQVIYNTSFEETINFSNEIEINQINLPSNYTSFWVNDINGDGEQDLILKGDYSLFVHYGMVNGKFQKNYQNIRLYLTNWVPSSQNLGERNIQFVDMNKDSLPDMLIQFQGTIALYVNTGESFLQKYVPGMFSGSGYSQNMISGDITGDGNKELATTIVGENKVLTLPLDRNGLGMLKTIDDGQGTLVELSYDKSKAVEGVPNRKTIIKAITKTSIGEGISNTVLEYENPVVHNKTKHFLGFTEIISLRDNLGNTKTNYIYDHDNRGLLDKTETTDFDNLEISRYLKNTYSVESFDGIQMSLLADSDKGFINSISEASSLLTTTSNFDLNSLCINITNQTDGSKYLTTNKTFQSIAVLSDHMTCFDDLVTLTGNSFSYNLDIDRDDHARVTQIKRAGVLQQQSIYGVNGKISSLWNIGTGITNFYYDNSYRLNSIQEPNGVQTDISSFDLRNDSPLEIVKNRNSDFYSQFFTYDGHVRLEKLWHNLGNYTINIPFKSYSYEYSTNQNYSVVSEFDNIQTNQNSSSRIDKYFAATASGKEVASIIDSGVFKTINSLKEYLPSQNIEKLFITYADNTLSNLMSLKPADLNFSTNPVSISETDYLGLNKTSSILTYQNLENNHSFLNSIINGKLETSSLENNTFQIQNTTDTWGHDTSHVDEAGNTYHYELDSLGRITKIIFPSLEEQAITYHSSLGFVESVSRDNIGRVDYVYDSATNLLTEKLFYGKANVLENKTVFSYDNIGRVIQKIHSNFDSQGSLIESQTYEYKYDGEYFNRVTDQTQLGFLTGIMGPKYIKEFKYDIDELPLEETIYFDGKKRISKYFDYYDQRVIKTIDYEVEDLITSQVLINRNFTYEYNQDNGEVENVLINSVPFFTYSYNNLNEVSSITYNGTFLSFDRDSATRKLIGISENGMTRSWSYNDRGLIDSRHLDFGPRTMNHSYTYSSNKYLNALSEIDSDGTNLNMSYSYDVDGIITSVTKDGINTTHDRFSDHWMLGTNRYDLDHIGRISAKNAKSFVYGPTGRIKEVIANSSSVATYYYDEENNPIAKIYSNGDEEFYFENQVLKNSDHYFPVQIPNNNHIVGYFKNNTFKKNSVDHLGTLIRDNGNVINVATPYGVRDTRSSEEHKILDFTLKGFDSDIEAVRMGRRYYDPQAKRFLTPDTYFLENPEKIIESPVEGNLYSYAGNNPISKVDPSGDALILGAVIGAAIDLSVSAYVGYKSGKFVETMTSGSTYVSAGISAAAGFTGAGLGSVAAKQGAKIATRQTLKRVAIEASINTAGSAAIGAGSKMTSNAINDKPLTRGVGKASLVGGVLGGAGSLISSGARGASQSRADRAWENASLKEKIGSTTVESTSQRGSTFVGVGNATSQTVSNSSPVFEEK